jgi:hypothetical protein
MISEQAILTTERLRDDLDEFRKLLNRRYKTASSQVTNTEHRKRAAQLAEIWLVEIATDKEIENAIGASTVADLNVNFQRLLTFSEHATVRSRYEAEIRSILNNFSLRIVLPLKQSRGKTFTPPAIVNLRTTDKLTAFVGQSFIERDKSVNELVSQTLGALGIKSITGERPKADSVSEKVKQLIEGQSIFVGIFTRRDKIARKQEWTTSSWVIDEKAYALGLRKRLVLIKEQGVGSIGGIQGDYEYLIFSRDRLGELVLQLIQLFDLTNSGLRK